MSPFSILLHSWPSRIDAPALDDLAVNVLVYLPLGLFALLTFAGSSRTGVAILASLLLGFLLSISLETAQVFVTTRVSSLFDVATDTIGAGIGAAAGALWRAVPHRRTQRPDSAFLLCCWALYQCFPFLPHLGHVNVAERRPVDVMLYFAEAVALVPLVDSLGGTNHRRRALLGTLLLLVPLKALLFGRTATLFETVSALAVFVIACVFPLRPVFAAVVVATAVAVHGLAPFIFLSAPHQFLWIPFQASFLSNWDQGLTVLLGKVFIYGALLWLLRESGVRLALAIAATALLLAAIEVTQIYLPGRSSEVTDPVMALILGWVFWSFHPCNNANRGTVSLTPTRGMQG